MTTAPTPTSGAADLRTAAQAVVDRLDTPLWKDVPATAEYIGRLRAALAAGRATAAQGDAIEHELAMLIRRIVSSARRNCQDESNVLKLANEAWAYLVRKGLVGSPLRDAGIESDVAPQAADSVQEDSARLDFLIEQRAYVVSYPDACPGYWLHWARPDGRTWVQGDEHPTPRAAIDAGRKQGARWKSAVRALTLHI